MSKSKNKDLNSNLTKPNVPNGKCRKRDKNDKDAKKKPKQSRNIDDLKGEVQFDEHLISISELCTRLATNLETGLTPAQAKEILARDGPNCLTPPKTKSEFVRFLENMFGWFNMLLWLGSLLCFTFYFIEVSTLEYVKLDNLCLGIALALVVFVSGLFSYYQERKSEDIMNSFKNMIPKTCLVIRAGQKSTLPVEQLVVGDLVEIKGGSIIPADIRIVSAQGVKVDNSSLTGESEPKTRSTNCTNNDPLETKNLAFFSTFCVEGSGRGVVVRVGDYTAMGRVAGLAAGIQKKSTPLSNDIAFFIKNITIVSMFFGVLFAVVAYIFVNFTVLNAIILAISLVVAQVPEGLLPTLTVALALTAKRVANKNCLVKNLEAVETLGSTSTICTDKTGTLTQNRMTVSHIWLNRAVVDADNLLGPANQKVNDDRSKAWKALVRVACLCSRAEFQPGQLNVPPIKREALGDASEVAILKYMEIVTGSVAGVRQRSPKVFEVPFNSTNKYSISVNESREENGTWLTMKGAPERIFERCSTMLLNDREIPLTPEVRQSFEDAYEALGSLGERVIGMCQTFLPKDKFPFDYPYDGDAENFPTHNLTFVGLVSMIDPPRPSVPDAVAKCRSAGIKVIMVTGDHPITAKAIARAVGIISEENETPEEVAKRLNLPAHEITVDMADALVVKGSDLREYSQEQVVDIIRNYKEIVFARTSPQQKLIIVEACQLLGMIVAVTGDGVNDSPALKKADIGIAMGISGSDISKQAADMILLDDNFSSIETGIEEGRVLFDNLKKSICYTLSSKVPEMTPFLLYFALEIPLFLGAISILCIDFGTDMVPAVSVAYEKAELDIMKRKPRNPRTERLVTEQLISFTYGQLGAIEAAAGFFVALAIMLENGFDPRDLLYIRRKWDSPAVFDVVDSFGQEWSYKQRKTLEYTCNTAFFATVVLTKWAALLVCKTRKLSLFQQGMRNHVLTFAMFFELCLVLMLSYTPGMSVGINMHPLKAHWWLLPLPFMVYMLAYAEVLKLLMRRNEKGWVHQEFYY